MVYCVKLHCICKKKIKKINRPTDSPDFWAKRAIQLFFWLHSRYKQSLHCACVASPFLDTIGKASRLCRGESYAYTRGVAIACSDFMETKLYSIFQPWDDVTQFYSHRWCYLIYSHRITFQSRLQRRG